jgi:hypothetical protein
VVRLNLIISTDLRNPLWIAIVGNKLTIRTFTLLEEWEDDQWWWIVSRSSVVSVRWHTWTCNEMDLSHLGFTRFLSLWNPRGSRSTQLVLCYVATVLEGLSILCLLIPRNLIIFEKSSRDSFWGNY